MASVNMKFPGWKSKAFTFSYDDGVRQDIRLMEIMKKNGLKGTFNLNSGLYGDVRLVRHGEIRDRLTMEEATALYAESGMEVASHGYKHVNLVHTATNLRVMEVANDRMHLEQQFQRLVRGFAYAGGTFNDEVADCLKTCGIAYARTVISTAGYQLPGDWYRWMPTCHHSAENLTELSRTFAEDTAHKGVWLFYLWGHSYEFDRDHNWERMEDLAGYMGGREDIWYATNIEIHDYVEAYRQLKYSMDGMIVQNPTWIDVYLEWNGEALCVKAGMTKTFRNGVWIDE